MVLVAGSRPVFESRGFRNKNPGNIRANPAFKWNGQIGVDDAGFVIFDSLENGIRAMGKIWDSYAERGVRSVGAIISTWAPSNENNTESYIRAVESRTGWDRTGIVTRANYSRLADAVIHHENGKQPLNSEFIEYGLSLA